MANPNTRHVVTQSTKVFAGGNRVGSVQTVTPSQTLTNAVIRELDADVAGEIIEIAIGVPSYTVSVSKFKLFQETFFEALGYVVQNIGQIVDPLDLQTTFTSNATGSIVARTFVDATINNFSDAINIGTVLITETANFTVRDVV